MLIDTLTFFLPSFYEAIICFLTYLYLMFSIEYRSIENLHSVFEFMNAEQSLLRTSIDGVELLVFTSSQLDKDSKGTFIVFMH